MCFRFVYFLDFFVPACASSLDYKINFLCNFSRCSEAFHLMNMLRMFVVFVATFLGDLTFSMYLQ